MKIITIDGNVKEVLGNVVLFSYLHQASKVA